MDKELLELLNAARANGANESQMQGIVDAYNQKKKNGLPSDGGKQTDVLEKPVSNLSVGSDGQLKESVPAISKSELPKNGINVPLDTFNPLKGITDTTPKVVTNDGVEFPISQATPFGNSPEVINSLQQRVTSKSVTDEDVQILAQSSGKSIDATKGYLIGGQLVGGSVENIENVNKTKDKLSNYIKDYNTIYGTKYEPNDVLSSSQKTFDFLELAKNTKANPPAQLNINQPISESTKLLKNVADIPALLPTDISNEMITQVVSSKVNENNKNGVSKDQTIIEIAKLTNPKEFARLEKTKNYKAPTLFGSNPAETIGNLFRDNTEQAELFNYQKGIAELQYNQAFKQNSINKISEGVLSGDQNLIQQGQHDLSQVDEDVKYKYPSLIKQEIAQRVNDEIARESGVVVGSDVEESKRLERAFGSSTKDRLAVMERLGYLDDPRTKDIAESMASNSTYFANNSILGSAVSSFLQPFAELGMSVADITSIRNIKDRTADKIKEQLFQTDFSANAPDGLQLKKDVRISRNIVNTTFNLAGMLAISTATEGVAGALGASASLAQRLGAYTSFGLPAFDTSLKDAPNMGIESVPAQYMYAAMTSIANAEGGRLLDLGKITRIPEVSPVLATLAKRITEKDISEKGARELLGEVENKYVDFAVKYGKNVTKGAATMAYFTTTNNILKLGFGDPNTKEEDILPQAGHAFLDGVLGMSIMGGFGAVADMGKEKNTTYKGTIYNMALNHDAAKDVFDIGLKNGEYDKAEYDSKIAILNTSIVAKNSLDAAQVETGIELTQDQKAVYVANKTAENVLRDKAANTKLPGLKAKYEAHAEKLSEQSTQTLDGLKFTPTLEPLYNLYNAEKEYNAALENYNPNIIESATVLETAKKKFDELNANYQTGVTVISPDKFNEPTTIGGEESSAVVTRPDQFSEPITIGGEPKPIETKPEETGVVVTPPQTFPEPTTIGSEQQTVTPETKPITVSEPSTEVEKKINQEHDTLFKEEAAKVGDIFETRIVEKGNPKDIRIKVKAIEDGKVTFDNGFKFDDLQGYINISAIERTGYKGGISGVYEFIKDKYAQSETKPITVSEPSTEVKSEVGSTVKSEEIKKLEEERDAKIKEISKPELKLDFVEESRLPKIETDATYKGEVIGKKMIVNPELIKRQKDIEDSFNKLQDFINCLTS